MMFVSLLLSTLAAAQEPGATELAVPVGSVATLASASGAAVQSPGPSEPGSASGSNTSALVSYDLRPVLPSFDEAARWTQSLVVTPGGYYDGLSMVDPARLGAQEAPDVVIDLLTQVLGDELTRKGREMSVDGTRLMVLAPQEVQGQVREILNVLEGVFSGVVELDVDILTLTEGEEQLVASNVMSTTEAERLVEGWVGRGAEHRRIPLRIAAGRTRGLVQTQKRPIVSDYDVEIAQGAFIFDPISLELESGLRLLARGVPQVGGLTLAMVLVQSELVGEVEEREIQLGGISSGEQGGFSTFPGPGRVQSGEVVTRSIAFESFLSPEQALVLAAETNRGGPRSRQLVVLRMRSAAVKPFAKYRIPGSDRALMMVNSEIFGPPRFGIRGRDGEQLEGYHPVMTAELDAEPSLFLFDWMRYRFNVWRQLGPWAAVVTDPAWDNLAGEELENLVASVRPTKDIVQVEVALSDQRGSGAQPMRFSLPLLDGSTCGVVLGRSRLALLDLDVEVAQFAAVADPAVAPLFDGLMLGLEVSRAGDGTSTVLDLQGSAQLQRGPMASFDPDSPTLCAIEEPDLESFAVNERIRLTSGEGGTPTAVIGADSKNGGQGGMSLEVRVRN